MQKIYLVNQLFDFFGWFFLFGRNQLDCGQSVSPAPQGAFKKKLRYSYFEIVKKVMVSQNLADFYQKYFKGAKTTVELMKER